MRDLSPGPPRLSNYFTPSSASVSPLPLPRTDDMAAQVPKTRPAADLNSLPAEVIDIVVSLVSDDPSALRRCFLVRPLQTAAARLWWRYVRIHGPVSMRGTQAPVLKALKNAASEYLFDGREHPFVLNDVPLGGPPDPAHASLDSLLRELRRIPGTWDPSPSPDALAALSAEPDLPACVRDLLSRPGLHAAMLQRLPSAPLVPDPRAGPGAWGMPLRVEAANLRGRLILMDGHGTCYWYAVWEPPHDGEQSKKGKEADGGEDAKVFVQFGGHPFEPGRTAYLTSRSMWGFLAGCAALAAGGDT